MNFQILLIILIIICYIYYYNYEHFDVRVTNVGKEKCGDMCSKIYGCIGFAYNDKNKMCYLSTNPIVGDPIGSKYQKEYDENLFFCNKPNPIMNGNDEMQVNAHKDNTVYLCKDGMDEFASFKSILDEKITDLKFKNSLIKIKPYKLKQLIWSNTKDLDPNYVNKNDYLNQIVFYDYDNENEYQGTNLFKEKCVNNIPLYDCLAKCTVEEECSGLEFNPLLLTDIGNGQFKKDNNVCCLKSSEINKFKRTKSHENGAYYKKSLEDDAQITSIYIRNKNY